MGDHETARKALESNQGYELALHLHSSKPFFMGMIGPVKAFYKAPCLTLVANIWQEEAHANQELEFDNGSFKVQTKDF